MLVPALAAFTAYLLCRHLTRSLWASLVGGYLFGFSSYMLGQEQGHLHMTAVFLLPLIALAVVRYVAGRARRPRPRLAARRALRAAVLALDRAARSPPRSPSASGSFSPTGSFPRRGRGSGRSGCPLLAGRRDRARSSPRPLAAYAALRLRSRTRSTTRALFDADLLNFVLPTHFVWAGGAAFAHVSQPLPRRPTPSRAPTSASRRS